MSKLQATSCLAILSAGEALKNQLDAWLAPHGWSCLQPDVAAPLPSVALFVIDGADGADYCVEQVGRVRGASSPIAGTPILLAGGVSALPASVSATLPTPLERASTIRLIEQWAGPIADHRFRTLDNPFYRLVRLGGMTTAQGLMASFADQLVEAVAWIDAPAPESPLPHQIAGLAGMIGFPELSDRWRAIDAGETADLPAVRALTLSIIEQIRRDLTTS